MGEIIIKTDILVCIDGEWFNERMRRLAREELKTRVLVNNSQMLVDILAEFDREWTKQ